MLLRLGSYLDFFLASVFLFLMTVDDVAIVCFSFITKLVSGAGQFFFFFCCVERRYRAISLPRRGARLPCVLLLLLLIPAPSADVYPTNISFSLFVAQTAIFNRARN